MKRSDKYIQFAHSFGFVDKLSIKLEDMKRTMIIAEYKNLDNIATDEYSFKALNPLDDTIDYGDYVVTLYKDGEEKTEVTTIRIENEKGQ